MMLEANKVTCQNSGNEDLKFRVGWIEGVKTRLGGYTDYYSASDVRSFDLDTFSIPSGAEVWIEVLFRSGISKVSASRFCYKPECGKERVYTVSGPLPDCVID